MNTTTSKGLTTEERSKLLLDLLLSRLNDSRRVADNILALMKSQYPISGELVPQQHIALQVDAFSLAYERLCIDMQAVRSVLLSPATEILIDGDSPFLESFRESEPIAFTPNLSTKEVQQYRELLT